MLRKEQIDRIARNCVHFRETQPCAPHARQGVTCRCQAYSPQSTRRLVIQLSSPTAVIRSSALVARFKADDPNCHITYLTQHPELLPTTVDQPLALDAGAMLLLQQDHFDELFNIDMDRRACAVTTMVNAQLQRGFSLRQGHCQPIDRNAQISFLRQLFPHTAAAHRPSGVQEIFGICGLDYRRETPRLQITNTRLNALDQARQPKVALHTSAIADSSPGPSWNEKNWTSLAKSAIDHGAEPTLLGDLHTDHCNTAMAHSLPLEYPGPLNWRGLITAINSCDVVVSAAQAVVELALALGKRAILLQGNGNCEPDIAVYHGRGTVITPEDASSSAADLTGIPPSAVLDAIVKQLEFSAGRNSTAAIATPSRSAAQTQTTSNQRPYTLRPLV